MNDKHFSSLSLHSTDKNQPFPNKIYSQRVGDGWWVGEAACKWLARSHLHNTRMAYMADEKTLPVYRFPLAMRSEQSSCVHFCCPLKVGMAAQVVQVVVEVMGDMVAMPVMVGRLLLLRKILDFLSWLRYAAVSCLMYNLFSLIYPRVYTLTCLHVQMNK